MLAYFAGGCFWCITPVFEMMGVEKVVSGYSGGDEVDPVYEDVKAQRTGHREAFMVRFDPEVVSFEKLVETFLEHVDPFDFGGQFIDRGHSYTLAIYYLDDEQKAVAEKMIAALEKESGKKCAVALEPFKSFYDAEEYHQDFYLKNPEKYEAELIESGRKKVEE
ncbi:MAG: peptide-methionine (S)-S-oxide reductase MsrA [Clostridiales bacterium]|nr:peptide-methionine (S)-S-oxide reductase MsrA [Candidatus Blautia equi]